MIPDKSFESNCCGYMMTEVSKGEGRCSKCKEMASAEECECCECVKSGDDCKCGCYCCKMD